MSNSSALAQSDARVYADDRVVTQTVRRTPRDRSFDHQYRSDLGCGDRVKLVARQFTPAKSSFAGRVGRSAHRCAIPIGRQYPVGIDHIVDWAKVRRHKFENLIADRGGSAPSGPSLSQAGCRSHLGPRPGVSGTGQAGRQVGRLVVASRRLRNAPRIATARHSGLGVRRAQPDELFDFWHCGM